MESSTKRQAIRDRVVCILKGEETDLLPFIDRLEIWYNSQRVSGKLPSRYKDMSLTEVHRAVGMGQQKFLVPYGFRLRGVEVVSSFEGRIFYREKEPVINEFPGMWDLVASGKPGVTVTELITPVGRLAVRHEQTQEGFRAGTVPYLTKRMIEDEAAYRIAEYIIERAEYVPRYDRFLEEESRIGDIGFVVASVQRIPFQQVLLEYLGETRLFYELHDNLRAVERLIAVLDEQLVEILHQLANLTALYVEFPDNLDGIMTNPKLFMKYCLPYYRRYAAILHGQGKRVGSHTDGNIRPLLHVLREADLDVCESFSPAPLTACEFEEAWHAWQNGPIIWGGIPSTVLEERNPESEFRDYVEHLLNTIGDQPIILGIGDLVMGNNSIDRVQYIASRVEEHVIR